MRPGKSTSHRSESASFSSNVLTLSGTDDLGAVNKTATTDATGFYQFLNIPAGTYPTMTAMQREARRGVREYVKP